MTPLHDLLKDGDPLRHEPPLDHGDLRAMRRTVLAVADSVAVASDSWRHPVMVTAMAALMLATVLTVARREQAEVPLDRVDAGPRQMQFVAPGGTRVFWTLQK